MGAQRANAKAAADRRFSRRWWMDSLRTAAWIVVITLLIWVYADLHFTVTEKVEVMLRIHADSAGRKMVVLGRTHVPITIRVKGNKHAIERLRGTGLSYDAAKELGPGVHRDRLTAMLLRRLGVFRSAALDLLGVDEPRSLTIHVDPTRTFANVPVEPDYSGGEPDGPIAVEPKRVTIHIPLSQMARVNPDGLTLKATVDLSDHRPGEKVRRQVAVAAPPGVVGAVIEPPTVEVALKVGLQTARKTLTVPINIQWPKAWLDDGTWTKYRLEDKPPEEWTRQLAVAGNRINLEKLTPSDARAYIVLTEADKKPTTAWLTREVKVEFQPDAKVRLAEPAAPVEFRLVKRTEPPTP